MSDEALRASLQEWLTEIGSGIDKARARLVSGDVKDQTRAAGDLAALEVRRDDLQRRLAEMDREPNRYTDAARDDFNGIANDTVAAVQRWLSTH